MNADDMGKIVDYWRSLGFEPHIEIDDKKSWHECCVIESMFGGPTLPCSWIAMTDDGSAAFLVGTDPGHVVGR